jgi:hypothetical protein
MPAARSTMLMLGIATLSLFVLPRSAASQVSPDWPYGGSSSHPYRDSERPVATSSATASEVSRVLRSLRIRIAASWLNRVQRPVGMASSAQVVQRRAVK